MCLFCESAPHTLTHISVIYFGRTIIPFLRPCIRYLLLYVAPLLATYSIGVGCGGAIRKSLRVIYVSSCTQAAICRFSVCLPEFSQWLQRLLRQRCGTQHPM